MTATVGICVKFKLRTDIASALGEGLSFGYYHCRASVTDPASLKVPTFGALTTLLKPLSVGHPCRHSS